MIAKLLRPSQFLYEVQYLDKADKSAIEACHNKADYDRDFKYLHTKTLYIQWQRYTNLMQLRKIAKRYIQETKSKLLTHTDQAKLIKPFEAIVQRYTYAYYCEPFGMIRYLRSDAQPDEYTKVMVSSICKYPRICPWCFCRDYTRIYRRISFFDSPVVSYSHLHVRATKKQLARIRDTLTRKLRYSYPDIEYVLMAQVNMNQTPMINDQYDFELILVMDGADVPSIGVNKKIECVNQIHKEIPKYRFIDETLPNIRSFDYGLMNSKLKGVADEDAARFEMLHNHWKAIYHSLSTTFHKKTIF